MSSYNRLIIHRLADIFGYLLIISCTWFTSIKNFWLLCGNSAFLIVLLGISRFAHESVGEGNDRHLVLQQCLETSMYVMNFVISNFFYGGISCLQLWPIHWYHFLLLRCGGFWITSRDALSFYSMQCLLLQCREKYHLGVHWMVVHLILLYRIVKFFYNEPSIKMKGYWLSWSNLLICRPSIFVSDILWQYDACDSPSMGYQLLRRDDACTGKLSLNTFFRGSSFGYWSYH